MPVPQSWITNAIQQGKVILKLVNLPTNILRHAFGSGQFRKCLREFEHGSPHATDLIFDFLSIDVNERTYGQTTIYDLYMVLTIILVIV